MKAKEKAINEILNIMNIKKGDNIYEETGIFLLLTLNNIIKEAKQEVFDDIEKEFNVPKYTYVKLRKKHLGEEE